MWKQAQLDGWADRVLRAIHTNTRESNKPYKFIGSCVGLDGPDINKMMEEEKEITLKTMKRHCDLSSFEHVLHYGRDFPLAKDWHISYHKSTYGGKPCYFLRHSAIEYVWVRHG